MLELVAAFSHVVILVKRIIDVDLGLREERKRLVHVGYRVEVPNFAAIIAWQRARNRIACGVKVRVVLHKVEQGFTEVYEL